MMGMDRTTGRRLEGWPHVEQSIRDILSTRIGSRVERRPYGSNVPNLLDDPQNDDTTMNLFTDVAEALDKWEPRVRLSKIQVLEAGADGRMKIALELFWLEAGETRTTEVLQ
ncbi:MAG: GPW/gp25 family protein [Pseudomonadota bacterium]